MTRPRASTLRLSLALAAVLALAGAAYVRRAPQMFELLSPRQTGIAFENRLPEDSSFNILNYLYYYNGGGVAAGDVNGDGKPDLYFTSNAGKSRLYLNRGGYRFDDATDRAGVGGVEGGWTTGVTMADVNGDGWLDIYVSGVNYLARRGRNALYVNDGVPAGRAGAVPTFTDRTAEYGLAHAGYSTQSLFFDYDGDGDLDMYLLNHSVHSEREIGRAGRQDGAHPAADRLFRNDPSPGGSGQGRRFTDVSEAAGIRDGEDGYGLGVVASDVNLDGCVDLYVANDFQGDDQLYVNGCDGTFTESVRRATGHTSRFSMGVDAADFDNDLRPDLFVADMLPEREDVLKTSAGVEGFNLFNLRLQAGYHPQYARNTLQRNEGRGRFAEIGYYAGVFATDWSWAPLFADLDDDGRKDLFITNGIYRRPNDLDYINYVGNEANQAALARGITKKELALLERMPRIALPNHVYRNEGNLRFTDMASAWGLGQAGFSNGAVYVDLNGTGALDLVVNRINAPAAIYRNHARELTGNGYLAVDLRGAGANTRGVGAKVIVAAGGQSQLVEQMPTRGFQSSVDTRLHFGVGRATVVDSVTVVWPDRRFQVIRGVRPNRTLVLAQDSASGRWSAPRAMPAAVAFEDATARLTADVTHAENRFDDYNREPLMPHLLSTEGPALAAGDVNGDGLTDLYVGGAKWQAGRLVLQRADGTLSPVEQPAFVADTMAEDVDAAFFDADGDRDLDLYVVSGGNEFWGDAPALADRLYLNDGRGRFARATDALPSFFENGACVVPGDFDGDGDVDLFVGSRVVAREYGRTPRSHLLRNDGRGRFADVTDAVAPGLARAGMVTSAVWTDYDRDGREDLVVVGEWMPVRVYRQEGGRLVERTRELGLAGTEGWWNRVEAADLDGDGREDLVLGNLGLNSYLRASATEPARLYVHEFAKNGSLQQYLTFYKHGVSYPLAGRDEFVKLIPSLRSKYTSYAAFGARRIEDILPASELAAAQMLEARTFASAIAMNGARGFTLTPLPTEAQLSPVRASVVEDFDGDGRVDLLLGGNFYGVPPLLGRYDASRGVLLRGLGGGRFEAVSGERSGLDVEGQVRRLAKLRGADGARLIAVARNGDKLQLLQIVGTQQVATGKSRR